MNVDVFLKSKSQENQLQEIVKTLDLYEDIQNEYLKSLFAVMHQEFNRLFKFMFYKKKSNNHYNAEESRKLIHFIKLYKDMQYVLKPTQYAFQINETYNRFINICDEFLVGSGGSDIPEDLEEIPLYEYEPIFTMVEVVSVLNPVNKGSYVLKNIGEGSYATVHKYKDEFYKKIFAVKKAKKDLKPKELIRFKQEYEVMSKLRSPYIIEVYRYDDEDNKYYMEYADETLKKYIDSNNSTLTIIERRNIANQVFRAFQYIHRRGYLHRDISFTNVLLHHYDNLSVVKISDFGLVKIEQSNLTSIDSEIKGSLNDSNLLAIGFENYSIEYETYALTRLIYYIMTGKYNLRSIKDGNVYKFVSRGVSQDVSKRFHNIEEMMEAFNVAFPALR